MKPQDLLEMVDTSWVEELTLYYNGRKTVIDVKNPPKELVDFEIAKIWNSGNGKGLSALLKDNVPDVAAPGEEATTTPPGDLISRKELKRVMELLFKYGGYDSNLVLKQIDNAPTIAPQKVVTIPHELIEKLVLCVVDTVENINWDKAIDAYKERQQSKWVRTPLYGRTYFVCDKCHARFDLMYNYCPHCGAKMEVNEDATN